MLRSPTNQNNISSNKSIIDMCTNSTTYTMISLDINHHLLYLFKVHSQLGFKKQCLIFKRFSSPTFDFCFI